MITSLGSISPIEIIFGKVLADSAAKSFNLGIINGMNDSMTNAAMIRRDSSIPSSLSNLFSPHIPCTNIAAIRNIIKKPTALIMMM
ncbi:hypothetical protein [Solobacterium moorei]|uniref:hypothetical protein n=1 Tax=Solobacterium moorei TaxID=102148 RepID=UPI0028D5E29B|nr:hypothetical protein [Solobacterium moorei]